MNPQSWRPLPGAIEEDEISIKLIWKANRRTRFALERQAKLSQFASVSDYLLDAIQFKTCQEFFVPPVTLPRFWPALVTVGSERLRHQWRPQRENLASRRLRGPGD